MTVEIVCTITRDERAAARREIRAAKRAEKKRSFANPHKVDPSKIEGILRTAGNKLFSIDFSTKDKPERRMTCRLNMPGSEKASTAEKDNFPYITVWDMSLKEFRNVNLSTVTAFTLDSIRYNVIR